MKRLLLAVGIVGLAACSDATSPTQAAHATNALRPAATLVLGNNTIVVSPTNLNGACATPVVCSSTFTSGWLFYNDESDAGDPALGSFVAGPGTPTYGTGSAQISVTGTQRRNLATYEFAGTPLADITVLKFRTYNPSAGNGGGTSRSAYLQFNVDFNGSDTWQRRLTFVPSLNGTVTPDTWKEWDAINGGNALWTYSGAVWPVTGGAGTVAKTWNQIKSDYAGVRIRVTDAQLSLRVGDPYSNGYTENIDSFTFGTSTGTTVYDFEPTATFGSCSVSVSGTTITLLSNCVTDKTLLIPDGYTLDGANYTITAVDPAGGHFLGAVVMNGGSLANVTNVRITASNLANTCDAGVDRLRGILLEAARGSITNNTVSGVRQGLSGCQEGNAIEVRAAPFDKTGTDFAVTISGNTVSNYQKNGITANGSVAAIITDNNVTGDGPITYTAQNGIQVGFGATATVRNNTVSGNNYTPVETEACGLLFYQADGVRASKNNLFGNEVNQCNVGKGGGKFNAVQ